MAGSKEAFTPLIGTLVINLTTAAAAGLSVSSLASEGLMLTNLSTNDAYMWVGPTSTWAAVLPSTAAAALNFPLLQRSKMVISTPGPGSYVSGVTTAALLTAQIAITPGLGIS